MTHAIIDVDRVLATSTAHGPARLTHAHPQNLEVSKGDCNRQTSPSARRSRWQSLLALRALLVFGVGAGILAGCDALPGDPSGQPIPGDGDTNGFGEMAKSFEIVTEDLSLGTYDFTIVRVDDEPVTGYRFVWNFEPSGDTVEGVTARYAFPVDGNFRVIVAAFTEDNRVAFALEHEQKVPPIPQFPPVARAGEDHTYMAGEQVCLDASASYDVNNDEITYVWWQIAGPPVVLRRQTNPAQICFSAPLVKEPAQLTFGLRTSDAIAFTEDTVVIRVLNVLGLELIADAGEDQIVPLGVEITLDGAASKSSRTGKLEFLWKQIGGPPVQLDAYDEAVARFMPDDFAEDQEIYTFELTVSQLGLVAIDEVQITVSKTGLIPSELLEDFDGLSAGAKPTDWLGTAELNGLEGDDSLFQVLDVDGNQTIATRSTATNIHAHYVGTGANAWSGYTFSGRMMVSTSGGGIGVTFLSDYPNSDRYYRLRSGSFPGGEYFHIAPHGTSITSGNTTTFIKPDDDVWYRFHIEVRDLPDATRIRAKVWPASSTQPTNWQIECFDESPTRLRSGTVGLWSMGPGTKHWDDLGVDNVHFVSITPLDPCARDTDQDGVVDCNDTCPDDPDKVEPGVCGCGISDVDSDASGTTDCLELPPSLLVSRTSLNFGLGVNSITFNVWNAGGDVLDYTITDNADWLTLSPASGNSAGEQDVVTATVNRSGLTNGSYRAEVTVTPSVGVPLTIVATLLMQPQTGALTPVARWDVVPRQRINAGETFNAGVIAFSKHGIREVQVHISGQGYTGQNPKIARTMTYNDQVKVWEYWVPISASEFTSDGMITMEAVVIGNDGGIRDKNTTPGNGLEALTMLVNPRGSLPSNVTYVDASSGNDGNGAVNNPQRPFRSIAKAMQAIATFQGGNADGGTVRLRPGDHVADGDANWGTVNARVVDEWITITHDPAAGGNVGNTRIVGVDNGYLCAFRLKVAGLTLMAPGIINGGNSEDSGRNSRSIWLKDCEIRGGSGDFPFPVGSGWRGPHYYTECNIRDQRRASGNGQNHRLMRNLTMVRTREDCFQSVPFGVNIFIDGVDPGAGSNPEHADVIQGPPALSAEGAFAHNWIWYNVVAKDLHYQGIFIRSGATSRNNAFVNCFLEMRAPIRNDQGTGRGSTFAGKYDHLILWNCTFLANGTPNKCTVGVYESTTVPSNEFAVRNASIRGCLFDQFRSSVHSGDKNWVRNPDVEFYDNHYLRVVTSNHGLSPDTGSGTISTGDPRVQMNASSNDFGRPLTGSPLIGRLSPPLVPADATGKAYGSTADVGALSH